MRKKIKVVLAILILSFISYLGYNIYTNLQHKKEVSLRIKTIPEFSFKTLKGVSFTQNNISKTLPKLFIYFNSECEFCNAEAKKIQANLASLKNIQLLFISHEDKQGIKKFAIKHQLNKQQNIVFLQDYKLQFSGIFDAKTLPFILLYSTDNKLIKKFKGSTNPKKILTYLSN